MEQENKDIYMGELSDAKASLGGGGSVWGKQLLRRESEYDTTDHGRCRID